MWNDGFFPLSQMVGTGLKERYWHVIEDKYPSKKEEGLTQAIARLVDLYAVLYMMVGGGLKRV